MAADLFNRENIDSFGIFAGAVFSFFGAWLLYRQHHPPSLQRRRKSALKEMRHDCDVLRRVRGDRSGAWTALYTVPCRVGEPFDREPLDDFPGALIRPSQIQAWPIEVPHGTDIELHDHLLVRMDGERKRFVVHKILGPYSDQETLRLLCDVNPYTETGKPEVRAPRAERPEISEVASD